MTVAHAGGLYVFEEASPLRYLRAAVNVSRPGYLAPVTEAGLKAEGAQCYVARRAQRRGGEYLAAGFYLLPLGRTFEVAGIVNATPIKGLGFAAFVAAEALGATVLNCFDGYLPALYARQGWRETCRTAFDPKLAPRHWNHARDGRPAVVFMRAPFDHER